MNTTLLLPCAGPLLAVGMMCQESADARLWTVKTADLPVHSQAAPDSPVVKTLPQGARVFVEIEIFSGAAWCSIRETDQPRSSGYVLCAHLSRPQQSNQTQWSVASTQTANPAKQPAPAQPPAAKPDVRRSLRDPGFWADRFEFSDEQRRLSEDLQRNSGIAACRDRLAQLYRANGITDLYSGLMAVARMGKSVSGMARIGQMGAELDRCGALYRSFWQKYVKLMTPKQKDQLSKDAYLVWFLTDLFSDPNTHFSAYVLQTMNAK